MRKELVFSVISVFATVALLNVQRSVILRHENFIPLLDACGAREHCPERAAPGPYAFPLLGQLPVLLDRLQAPPQPPADPDRACSCLAAALNNALAWAAAAGSRALGALAAAARASPWVARAVVAADGVGCMMAEVFAQAWASAVGRFWLLKAVEVVAAVVALITVVDLRSGAREALCSCATLFITAVPLGFSNALAAVWLPCYLLLRKARQEGEDIRASRAPLLAEMALWPATALLLAYGRLVLPPHTQIIAIVSLITGGLVASEVWRRASAARGPRPGAAAAAGALRVVATACFALHAAAAADLAHAYGWDLPAALRAAAAPALSPSADSIAAALLFHCLTGSVLAGALFAAAELGAAGAVRLVAASAVAGPGAALALACAEREGRLARRAGQGTAPLSADMMDAIGYAPLKGEP